MIPVIALTAVILLQSAVIFFSFRLLSFSQKMIWITFVILMFIVVGYQGLALYGYFNDHHWINTVFAVVSPLLSSAILAAIILGMPRLRRLVEYERGLIKREALYREMFEKNPAVQLLVDPSTGQIVDANPAASRFYGYTRDTLQTMNINQINTLPPEMIRLEMQQALYEKRHFFFFKHRLSSGDIRDVEVSSAPIQLEGRTLLYSIVFDITERRQAERETRQLIRELDAFAYTVAHDLKAPLSIILGYAQLLRSELSEDDFKTLITRKIETTTQKMGHIIDELLLFARSYEKESVQYEALNMQQIVEEVQQRLSPLIEQGHAEVTLSEYWPPAVGHAAWVEEVWMNYLTNALKYGGSPPHITLGADSQVNGLARFWVRDSGQGLDEEQQAILFQPFQRLDKNNPDSTGLGLWICRRLIERQGGKVGVSSRPGEGSLFYFTLPIPNGSQAPPEDESG